MNAAKRFLRKFKDDDEMCSMAFTVKMMEFYAKEHAISFAKDGIPIIFDSGDAEKLYNDWITNKQQP